MSQVNGVLPGRVESGPDNLGQVIVHVEKLGGTIRTPAPIATLMSGGGRGSWVMPEVGDDVLVAFEDGNVDKPYVVGFLWNGDDRPPTDDYQLRVIRSVNGHEVAIYDPAVSGGDTGFVQIKDAHGNEVTLANASITIRSVGLINIQAPSVLINGRPVAPNPQPI